MNAAVNGRFLTRRITGVERFGREILRCMEAKFRVIHTTRWARGAIGYAWEQIILPAHIRPYEILWSPANLGPLAVRKQVLTLHDLSPLENPGWFSPHFALWYRLFIPALVQRVRCVTVPSSYVRDKVLRLFRVRSDHVTVVSGGVDTVRFNPKAVPLEEVPERYILFVGSLQLRKNLNILLHAWRKICHHFPDVWLIAAGGTYGNFSRENLPVDLERFRQLGYVCEENLPGLYAGAEVFVLPSLDEGFGLPILEAMACGTTVIVARSGAMPEVADKAALLFNPTQVDELAGMLVHCLDDPAMRCSMAEKGLARAREFSWDDSARRLWEVLQQCQ